MARKLGTGRPGREPKTTTTKTSRTLRPFRFLDLPPEPRNSVYECLLMGSRTTIKPFYPSREQPKEWYFTHQFAATSDELHPEGFSFAPVYKGFPAILMSNKQMRQEARSVFHACTTWTFDRRSHAALLLRWLGPTQAARVKEFCLGDVRPRSGVLTHMYGVECARELVAGLKRQGVCVGSGLVRLQLTAVGGRRLWTGDLEGKLG